MSLRKAEVGENAVAQVLSNEPTGVDNYLSATQVIGPDNLAHVLRIEPRRKRGGSHQIAEHDSELPTFSGVVRGRRGASRGARRGRCSAGKFADRSQHLQPVTERDAEVL